MIKQEIIAPAKGRVLRNHQKDFKVISDDGEVVDYDRTFKRRVKDGDAVIVSTAPEKTQKQVSESKFDTGKNKNKTGTNVSSDKSSTSEGE